MTNLETAARLAIKYCDQRTFDPVNRDKYIGVCMLAILFALETLDRERLERGPHAVWLNEFQVPLTPAPDVGTAKGVAEIIYDKTTLDTLTGKGLL